MKSNKDKLNYTFRVVRNGKTMEKCQTHSKRRFSNKIRTINWQNKPSKVYLRVSYGKGEDVFGKIVNFYNDGWYDNKKDLLFALNTFSEEEI